MTSGVVYPRAVAELSKTYRFRGLGGASAGAMAAAAAGAAELGRQTGRVEAFDELAAVADEVAQPDFILDLFPPQPPAAPVVRAARVWRRYVQWRRARRGRPGVVEQGLAALGATLYGRVPAIWIGLACGLLLVALGMWPAVHVIRTEAGLSAGLAGLVLAVALLLGTAVGLAGGAIGHALGLLRWLNRAESHFGLSTGRTADGRGLVDWLDAMYQRLAGRPHRTADGLLTFGALAEHGVDLRMVTTRLDAAHPMVLSTSGVHGRGRATTPLLFCAAELARLFPAHMVEHMVAHAGAIEGARLSLPSGFYVLPPTRDLPVVVGVRMSLSFPVLLSAVPLYTVPSPLFAEARAAGGVTVPVAALHRAWFSDGGIAANMPVNLFDDWLPARPTLGITLREGTPQADPDSAVRLLRAKDREPPPLRQITSLGGLIGAVVEAARSYRDNDQMAMASYRERIVQIYLSSAEGGLNLDMPSAVISGLAERGAAAGRLLREDFAFREHQWVRLRLLLSHLEENLVRIWRQLAPEVGFEAWVEQLFAEQLAVAGTEPQWYRPEDAAWIDEARSRLEPLVHLMEAWSAAAHFQTDRPAPYGVMRVASEL